MPSQNNKRESDHLRMCSFFKASSERYEGHPWPCYSTDKSVHQIPPGYVLRLLLLRSNKCCDRDLWMLRDLFVIPMRHLPYKTFKNLHNLRSSVSCFIWLHALSVFWNQPESVLVLMSRVLPRARVHQKSKQFRAMLPLLNGFVNCCSLDQKCSYLRIWSTSFIVRLNEISTIWTRMSKQMPGTVATWTTSKPVTTGCCINAVPNRTPECARVQRHKAQWDSCEITSKNITKTKILWFFFPIGTFNSIQKWSNSSIQLPVKVQYFVRKPFRIHVVVQSCLTFGNSFLGSSDANTMKSLMPSRGGATPGSIRMMYWVKTRITGTEISKVMLVFGSTLCRKEREATTCSKTAHAQAQ